jgi:hypothetical protein
MNATPTPTGLPIPGLETVYDSLAEAIDRAGEEKAKLFLVKLALLNANALADAQRLRDHIEIALRDL